jgi:hypothetical protein
MYVINHYHAKHSDIISGNITQDESRFYPAIDEDTCQKRQNI